MSEEYTLNQWSFIEEERLQSFRRYWREMNKKDHEAFPEQMPLGEWDEQYLAFDQE